MKRKYFKPRMSVSEFDVHDIITTSSDSPVEAKYRTSESLTVTNSYEGTDSLVVLDWD
ncbi:MAG: hypothetical protein ACI4CT_04540 [Lachnospiraceae bacterium]